MSKLLTMTMALVFLKHTSCDTPAACMDRIVGGTKINITEVPSMVAIHIDKKFACGGSIIDKCWILTAAHCALAASSKRYSIRSGSSFRETGGVIHKVLKLIVHPKYDDETLQNDIMLVNVDPCFETNAETQLATLPKDESSANENCGLVTGWGVLEEDSKDPSPELRAVMLPHQSYEFCKQAYEDILDITQNMTCYGYKKGGEDACQGDSGGPIFNMDNILVATNSAGYGCARPNYPGIYTKVVRYLGWIKESMKNNS
ncbi:hypothetical protein KM043_001068 [Ampulex compressa]|nr:hypothetical protein KM043_001068 [Ampulex compressa]